MDRKKVIFGLILVFLGLLLLGRSMDLYFFTFGHLIRFLVPFAFILLGIWLIVRKKSQEDRLKAQMQDWASSMKAGESASPRQDYRGTQTTGIPSAGTQPASFETKVGPPSAKAGAGTGAGVVKYSKFLGDLFIDCANMSLQNVDVSMGIGDAEIKLHGGRLVHGLNRMIISGFIGDVRLFVPRDMPFYIHSSNFIGDIDIGEKRASGFSNSLESQSTDYETAESKLYIAVNNFIGDVKVFIV